MKCLYCNTKFDINEIDFKCPECQTRYTHCDYCGRVFETDTGYEKCCCHECYSKEV